MDLNYFLKIFFLSFLNFELSVMMTRLMCLNSFLIFTGPSVDDNGMQATLPDIVQEASVPIRQAVVPEIECDAVVEVFASAIVSNSSEEITDNWDASVDVEYDKWANNSSDSIDVILLDN